MTTISFSFSPTANPPFQTTVMLDGVNYTLSALFNFPSQRWYFTITNSSNVVVLCRPITGSPVGSDINLLFGYFSVSTLVYRSSTGNFEVGP
ncbi:MAG: phage baseplate plug family protein [Thermoplasmataceae archaeon]